MDRSFVSVRSSNYHIMINTNQKFKDIQAVQDAIRCLKNFIGRAPQQVAQFGSGCRTGPQSLSRGLGRHRDVACLAAFAGRRNI